MSLSYYRVDECLDLVRVWFERLLPIRLSLLPPCCRGRPEMVVTLSVCDVDVTVLFAPIASTHDYPVTFKPAC